MTNAGLLELKSDRGRQSTPDHIADTLRRAICEGRIAGGAQLKQTEVATTFGVSIVPVREAFSRLVADGLATLIPNRGEIGRASCRERVVSTCRFWWSPVH